ncbi:MAG: arylesterase [Cyclobacteriaceae bacterium]
MMVVNKVLIIALVLIFQVEQKTILFFGDSITAGYGLSIEEAFPSHVEKILSNQGKKVKVVNAGLSGETSAGGLSRIDWILRQNIDVFVLELGANDGLRGLPLSQTKTNLQAIIDKVKAKNPKVSIVLAGMMVPPNLGKEYTTEFRDIYPMLAKKNDATLIPFLLEGVAGDDKLNIADGIHPNVEGHKIVGKNVVKIIEPLL